MTLKISAVINTLNEEANLPYALRSLTPWVDEIVVVDMFSDDRTVEIAREHGARVVMHERTFAVDGGRAAALGQATGDWVILLDADEVVPPALARRLVAVAREGATDIVEIPFLNYLLGAPLMGTGWGPNDHGMARFFRRGSMIPSDRIHAYIRPAEGARVLRLPFRPEESVHHFNYLDSSHFLEKLNRYTGVEASERFATGRRTTPGWALLMATREFLVRYVRRRGYRDGWRGFYLSLFMAFYRIASFAKTTELKHRVDRDGVRASYRETAERLLAEYGPPIPTPPRVRAGTAAGGG